MQVVCMGIKLIPGKAIGEMAMASAEGVVGDGLSGGELFECAAGVVADFPVLEAELDGDLMGLSA